MPKLAKLLFCLVLVLSKTLVGQKNDISSDPKIVENFAKASRSFMNGDYKGAIPFYEKAFQKDSLVSKPYWYVLVDNLGMSYAISGDLKSGEKIFRYGVSKDPTYPMFYYNLACTFAENNNLDSSISFLRLAFQNKHNMIEGESFPKPEKDEGQCLLPKSIEFGYVEFPAGRSFTFFEHQATGGFNYVMVATSKYRFKDKRYLGTGRLWSSERSERYINYFFDILESFKEGQ